MKLRIAVNKGCKNKTNPDQVASGWSNIVEDIDWLSRWVTAGYGWCATHLADRYRLSENCRGSNVIVLDIDGDTSLEAFWQTQTARDWCIATYTSASHSPDEHRFRAIFPTAIELTSVAQHRALYWAVTQRLLADLGLEKLSDNCGQKPERLWYGNQKAQFKFNLDAVIPDFFIDGLNYAEDYTFETQDVKQIDIDRCEWLLKNFLNPSEDGEYETVYLPVMAACASIGEPIFDVWVEWVLKGHHGQKQENTKAFKWKGLGTQSGHTKLYRMAKDQDANWASCLPSHLAFSSKVDKSYTHVDPDIDYSNLSSQELAQIGSKPTEQAAAEPLPDVSKVDRKRGRPKKTDDNLAAERVNDIAQVEKYLPGLRRNTLTRQIEYTDNGRIKRLEGDAIECMTTHFCVKHGVFIPENRMKNAITFLANENSFCPIQQYLNRCSKAEPFPDWDNLGQIFLNNNNPLSTLVLQRMMIGACARAFEPGSTMSWIPILVGAQGAGKSMFARSLVPEHLFAEMTCSIEMLMKEMFRLHCAWIIELPEVDHYFGVRNIENFKNLITTRRDEVRFPYDRLPTQLDRRMVMIGTTNRNQFLIDSSGNRRFLPLEIAPGFQIPWRYLIEHRDSLWHMALKQYHAGDRYEFTSGEIMDHHDYINEFGNPDPWLDTISAFVANFEYVSCPQILRDCLSIDTDRQSRALSSRVADVLTTLRWRRTTVGRIPGYNKTARRWQRSPAAHPKEEDLRDF